MHEGMTCHGITSVWLRNFKMYSRTWKLNLLPNFFEPVFLLLGLGLGVGFYIQEVAGYPYAVFIAPGLIGMAAMNGASFETTYNVFVRMNYDRVYDAMMAAPLNEAEIVAGEILWAVARSFLYGGAFLLIIIIFGLIPSWWAIGVLPVLVLTGYLFSTIGMAFSLTIPTIDLFSFFFTLFLTPLYIFSDTFFPLSERLGPEWMWVPEITPLFHSVRMMRAFCLGKLSTVLWWDAAYLLGVGIFFHWVSLKRFGIRLHKPAR